MLLLGELTCYQSRITQLLHEINLLVSECAWDQFHSPKNLAMSLQIESAEVAEHFVCLTEPQSYALTSEQKENVADELGDVFLNLLLLSEKLDVDLPEACLKKLEKIKKKLSPPFIERKSNQIYKTLRTIVIKYLHLDINTLPCLLLSR